jgi:hypothetical protein
MCPPVASRSSSLASQQGLVWQPSFAFRDLVLSAAFAAAHAFLLLMGLIFRVCVCACDRKEWIEVDYQRLVGKANHHCFLQF